MFHIAVGRRRADKQIDSKDADGVALDPHPDEFAGMTGGMELIMDRLNRLLDGEEVPALHGFLTKPHLGRLQDEAIDMYNTCNDWTRVVLLPMLSIRPVDPWEGDLSHRWRDQPAKTLSAEWMEERLLAVRAGNGNFRVWFDLHGALRGKSFLQVAGPKGQSRRTTKFAQLLEAGTNHAARIGRWADHVPLLEYAGISFDADVLGQKPITGTQATYWLQPSDHFRKHGGDVGAFSFELVQALFPSVLVVRPELSFAVPFGAAAVQTEPLSPKQLARRVEVAIQALNVKEAREALARVWERNPSARQDPVLAIALDAERAVDRWGPEMPYSDRIPASWQFDEASRLDLNVGFAAFATRSLTPIGRSLKKYIPQMTSGMDQVAGVKFVDDWEQMAAYSAYGVYRSPEVTEVVQAMVTTCTLAGDLARGRVLAPELLRDSDGPGITGRGQTLVT